MAHEHVSSILKKLPEERVNSKSFNEAFQLDEIPLWYFLEHLMDAYLPKPFKAPWEIENAIKSGYMPSLLDKLKLSRSSFALRKGLMLNERIKFFISRMGKKPEKAEIADALFINLTSQISEKNRKLKFLDSGEIINYLKERKKARPLVLICDSFSKNSLFKLRKYRPLLYEYITPEILEKSKRLSHELNEKWKGLNEKVKIKMFTLKRKNYWGFFKNNMELLFSKEFLFTLIKYYLTFKEIVKKHDVKIVYLTSLGGFYGLTALGAAYKLDRKIVYVSHGYTGVPAGKREFMKNIVIAASGAEEKRNFLRGGIKKENVSITGSPFYDEIAIYRRKKVPKTRGKTIGLLTTALVEGKYIEKEEYFKLICETLAQITNVKEVEKVIIKLHPREKYKSEYESVVKSLGLKNVKIIQEPGKASLYTVIGNSDLLIGFGSTALLEGLMIGKDAIHLEMLETRPIFEFKKAAFCVKEISEVGKAIKKILTDERVRKKLNVQREKYLRQAFYAIDGKAHERVADLITSLIKERR